MKVYDNFVIFLYTSVDQQQLSAVSIPTLYVDPVPSSSTSLQPTPVPVHGPVQCLALVILAQCIGLA